MDEGGDLKDVWNFTKSLPARLKGVFTGKRLDYRPQDREFLRKYGQCPIVSLTVYRQPVPEYLTQVLNFITLGKWGQMQAQSGYDKFFHLYLKVDYLYNGVVKTCKIEKNEVISITDGWTEKDETNADSFPIKYDPKSITINTLLQKTLAKMGNENYFTYNYATNNCQVYILSILDANDLLPTNPAAKHFIYQDVSKIVKGVDGFVSKVANFATDTAHRANIAVHGAGIKR